MNSLIESLNGWGARFLDFAWPMFWQSTLLIALIFAIEFALRRKVRAAIRYALWLAVLIKLLLPPSLALPTSLAWWLRPGAAAPASAPARTFVVTATVSAPTLSPLYYPAPPVRPKPAPVRTPMSPAAWSLIGWCCMSLGLLGWLVIRWQRVTGKMQRAARTLSPASGVTLQQLFDEAKRAAGVRRVVRLRLIEQPISPAVYGLFHPVILLPQSLVERIAPEQLRAVLLHEVIHFRRADVWINCAQSLLQIVYWWHPLVWLANARIRRVREEAVDDAVMLALRGDAEHYAPALLEVAKLALSRPLATLGLVGILESRSALKHRIERLMNFTMPRRAGLSFVSVLGLAAFSALALPMGEAPPKANSQLAQAGPSPSTPLPDRDGATGGKQVPSRAETSDSIASPRTNGVLAAAPQSSGPASAPPAQSSSSARSASAASTNLVYTSSDRQNILRKLEQIRISRFSCDGEPLSEVILRLAIETRELDPDKQGIRILLGPEQNAAKVATGTIDPNTGLPVATPASLTEHYLDSVVIRLKEPLTDVRLASVLEAIVKSADKPIKYSTLDQGVLFSPKSPQPELYMRSFKVDPNAFFLRLQEAGAVSYSANDTPDQPGPVVVPKVHVGGTGFAYWNGSGGDGFNFVSTTNSIGGGDPAIIKYFLSMGVDLRPGTGKNVFYGDRYGNLLFNATKHDLNIIEAALQTLNLSPPQIHIKTKFIVVPESFTNLLAKWAPTNSAGTGVCASVLTPTQASGFLRDLESKTGTTLLTEGEVTTFSGRPAQIQQVDLKYIATMTTNGVLKSEPYPLGPTLDIVPHAASDGSILMVVSPQLLEFVGYDDPGPFQIQVTNSSGAVETASLLLPHFRVRQASLSANVPDGHTLVISGMSAVDVVREKNKVPVLGDLPIVGKLFRSERNGTLKNQLIVLVTPTIIDPAGNRLHPEDK